MPIHRGIKQCSYVRPDGRRCGSPACNIDGRCYHHDRERYPEPLQVTPQLREIADVLSDPLFEQWMTEVADRYASNHDVTEELFSALKLFLGYDLREKPNHKMGPRASRPSETQSPLHAMPNEVRDPAAAATSKTNPRSSAEIRG